MSLIGKGTSSLRKKDVMEQKSIALGFKKMVFAHKANVGETGINLTALVTPTEMSAYGFVNPSVAELSRVNINQFKNNLKLVSSLAGILIPNLSYNTNSATYISFNGFTAAQDEIFVGYIDEAPTTSLSVVDGSPIVASGILLAGNTDFNIGMPIPINDNPATQMGAVVVFADRGLQYRKVGNVTGGDGDYIEVPVAGGLGSLIRFNASGSDRFITVMSNGVVAERPDGSMTAMIERVQGQVDQMIPTLADLAGVPETNFQTAPNDVNLKQFGDTVIDQQIAIDDLEATTTNHEDRIVELEDHDAFGAWETKSEATNYQAEEDGFFVGYGISTSTTSGLVKVDAKTDSAGTPTVIRGSFTISAHINAQNAAGMTGGFTIPVKKGDYYRADFTTIAGAVTVTRTYYWIRKG